MPTKSPRKDAELLSIKDNQKFLERLAMTLTPRSSTRLELEDYPAAARMMLLLNGFYLYVGNDGLWKWFSMWPNVTYTPQMIAWCRKLGAKRTAAYLTKAARLFPDGRIPAEDEVDDWLEAIEETKGQRAPGDKWRGVDDLHRLDMEFDDSRDEMAAAVRRVLQAAGDEFPATFERIASVKAAPLPTARASKKKSAKRGRPARQEAAPLAARQGLAFRTLQNPGAKDPLLERFCSEHEKISLKAWETIVERRLAADETAWDAAVRELRLAIFEVMTGLAYPKKQEKVRHRQLDDAWTRVMTPVLKDFPKQFKLKGKPAPFQSTIARLTWEIAQALYVYDDLVRTAEGKRATRTFFAPLKGYATQP